MSFSKSGVAAIVLGIALAATVLTPALGGPSLRKLVKKEVAKQIAKATGPRGAQGGQGATGPTGPAGPAGPVFGSFGGASGGCCTTPAKEAVFHSRTVTTPTAGKLLAMASIPALEINCSAPANSEVGLYVDDVAVPETKRDLIDNVSENVIIFGVTSSSLPAGAHSVQIGAACDGAATATTFAGATDISLGGVLLSP